MKGSNPGLLGMTPQKEAAIAAYKALRIPKIEGYLLVRAPKSMIYEDYAPSSFNLCIKDARIDKIERY